MKLAIVGKGGAGKTTLAAGLARQLASTGRSVIAVDADPDGNLGAALGIPPDLLPQPIADMRDLIRQRTGVGDGPGLIFTLNPKVDDLPERFSVSTGKVRLLVLGTVELGGKGCMCPEGAVLKALMQHLLLRVPDDVILDMEAGLEHMGRASARGVDALIAVVEPGMRSVQTATRVAKLAKDIGVLRTFVVLNRLRGPDDETTLRQELAGHTILGTIAYCPELVEADLRGRPAELSIPAFAAALRQIHAALEQQLATAAAGGIQ